MTIQEMISHYDLRDLGDGRLQIRRKDISDAELAMLRDHKPAILTYMKEQQEARKASASREAEERRILDKALYDEARAGSDQFILVVNFDTSLTGATLAVAEVLPPESLDKYAEWFRSDCVSIPVCHLKLDHLRSEDYRFAFDGRQRYHNLQCYDAIPVTPEEWDLLERLETERADAERKEKEEEVRRLAACKAEMETRKQALLSHVDSWETTSRLISDEGGKTKVYRHIITANGQTLIFTERNIFDLGRVINPDYYIADGIRGGLCRTVDGKDTWTVFADGTGWTPVRDLTDLERLCMELIEGYGPYASASIRM